MNRVEAIHALIAQQRTMGLNPQEIHANQTTVESFTVEAGLKPVMDADARSLIQRLRAPEDRPAPRYVFDGIRVVANAAVPGNALILRPAQLMNDPMWLQNHVRFGEAPAGAPMGGIQEIPTQGTPWHQKAAKADAPADEDQDTLELLNATGGITPTSVVMKAMEGIESIDGVIVLRYKRGDVELCSTYDRLSIMGALQDAMTYVMRQGQ